MAETSSSGALIAQANRFMDSIGEPASLDDLVRNLQELERFKEEMGNRGFGAPFAGMAEAKRAEELEEAEARDIKKQVRKMKELANAKRFTLNRVRVAIAANKIAMRAMARDMAEVVRSLPLGGNYIAQLVRHGEHAAHSYGVLLDAMSDAGKANESSVLVTVEREENGRKVRERIRLMSDQKVEARIRRAYGEGARVVSTEVRKPKNALVRSRSARVCVASAYASRASAQAAKDFDSKIRRDSRMAAYVEVMRRNGISDLSAIEDDDDRYFSVMGQLERKGLAQKGEEGYVLDETVVDAVEERRRELRAKAARLASEALALDLFKYYMSTPARKRESEPLFPGLAGSLAVRQVRMFGPLSRKLGVKDAGSLLLEKMDNERLSSGLKGDVFGGALFSLRSTMDARRCAELFGIGRKELEEARGKVEALLSGGTRARKFVELVKDARDKRKQ